MRNINSMNIDEAIVNVYDYINLKPKSVKHNFNKNMRGIEFKYDDSKCSYNPRKNTIYINTDNLYYIQHLLLRVASTPLFVLNKNNKFCITSGLDILGQRYGINAGTTSLINEIICSQNNVSDCNMNITLKEMMRLFYYIVGKKYINYYFKGDAFGFIKDITKEQNVSKKKIKSFIKAMNLYKETEDMCSKKKKQLNLDLNQYVGDISKEEMRLEYKQIKLIEYYRTYRSEFTSCDQEILQRFERLVSSMIQFYNSCQCPKIELDVFISELDSIGSKCSSIIGGKEKIDELLSLNFINGEYEDYKKKKTINRSV